MSERVLAWTFEPDGFHRWLIPRVVHDSQLDVSALRATALEVASSGDVVVDDYLGGLRIFRDDPEGWDSVFTPDPNVNATDEHYAIVMAGHLRPTSEISWWSHRVALGAMQHLGWDGDPSFLWRGRSLATLAAETENAALADAMAGVRPSLGGWLSVEDARLQLESLADARSQAVVGDPTPWFRGTYFESLSTSELTERTILAFSELSVMLKTAVDREEALRLVLWS